MTDYEWFHQSLQFSRPAVGITAMLFASNGFSVLMPEDQPDGAHSDSGDLYVKRDGKRWFIEVKRIRQCFNSRETWKFRNYIVDRCATFDKKGITPDAYITISHDLAGFALAKKSAFQHMTIEVKNNPCYNTRSPYYVLDLDHIKFGAIDLMMPT